MPIRVLIVDDSSFFRRRISEIVSKDSTMEVAGFATNGKEAVDKVSELKPDVVTMDVEMPIMNGIDAVKSIMSTNPTPIIMFSSLTEEGATATFNALDAGALDFITKNFDDIARNRDEAIELIRAKIKNISRQKFQASRIARARYGVSSFSASTSAGTDSSATAKTALSFAQSSRNAAGSFRKSSDTVSSPGGSVFSSRPLDRNSNLTGRTSSVLPDRGTVASRFGHNSSQTVPAAGIFSQPAKKPCSVPEISAVSYRASGKKYSLLAIGSSTGGPVALQEVLTNLPENFPLPIVIIQHMPSTFTASFAARLDKICKISVCEAKNGDVLKPGTAYLAPGGMQLYVENRGFQKVIRIRESEPTMCYKPCVDISFESINKSYGGSVLALILTGMGADGKEGCRKLKASGASIWAQNEETCVIYGMPQAVVNAGIVNYVVPIREFAGCIRREVMNT
jgi:two-component system chemotaxis response regulator CheB